MGLEATLAPLAGQVREILSGRTDGASEVAAAIARPPGAVGWFTPDDPIWTVHGSVATFLGGVRSLLFQALHPLALAGVDRHSTYREDPFGRLQRTGCSRPSWSRAASPRSWISESGSWRPGRRSAAPAR